MTTFNDYKNVTLQNLVDNPDCTEDDVAQWVRDNSDKFEDDSHPGEFSQDKVNKLFGDLLNNNSLGSLGNLGIDCSSVVDWFNIFGSQEEEEEEPEQGWNITDAVLTMGKIFGMPGSTPAKKPVRKSAGGFGLGKIDLGTLIRLSGNAKLKKVYWVLRRAYREISKLWSTKKRRTTRRKTTAKKTTSRSRTTTAKKTTSRSTTAKKTSARTTAAKKTTAKKTTTRSTTAKKTR